jgi:hypothetical protein
MARITEAEAQAWVEATKFTITSPFTVQDTNLLVQLEEEVISRVANAYPVDYLTWTTPANTPRLIRVAIAKKFVAWAYRRQYSESLIEDDAAYARMLEANAEMIIAGIVDGTIEVPAVPSDLGPIFYPTDASSAMEPTSADRSLGPPKFSMGMMF